MPIHQLRIRPELHEDISGVATILTEAFGGDAESQLVRRLRQRADALCLVAALGGVVVGHIAFPPVTAGDADAGVSAFGLAPLAVQPAYQHQGIGSALVRAGLEILERAGANIVVVLGDPAYYSRFGFRPASLFNLTCKWSKHQNAF